MPRQHTVAIELDSDRDLTRLSCSRLRIERIAADRYAVTSTVRLSRSECRPFVERTIRRRLPGLSYISGVCSAPAGYFWNPLLISPHAGATA